MNLYVSDLDFSRNLMESTVALFMLQSRPGPQMLGTQLVAQAPGSTIRSSSARMLHKSWLFQSGYSNCHSGFINTFAQHTAINEMTMIHGI